MTGSFPPDEVAYKAAIDALAYADVSGGDTWEEALSRLLRNEGYDVVPDSRQMDNLVARIRYVMRRKDEVRAARKLLDRITDEYTPLREEWVSWYETSGVADADGEVTFTQIDDVIYIGDTPISALRFERVITRLLALRNRVQELSDRFPELELEDTFASRQAYERAAKYISTLRSRVVQTRAAVERDRRLAARHRPEPEPDGDPAVCSSCGRRVRVAVIVTDDTGRPINDPLCKRCAHEFGLMPRGKIGEG